jgi:hypothetical protein
MNLTLLHGAVSKGSFISLTGQGVATIAYSNITSGSLGAASTPLIQVTGKGEIYLLEVEISNLTLAISSGSSMLPLIYLLGNSSLIILNGVVKNVSSNSTSGVIFSDVNSGSSRSVQVLLNSTLFCNITNSNSTQGVVGTVLGSDTSNITITNVQFISTISGNNGSTLGGGLYIGSCNIVNVSGCQFDGIGSVKSGGGLYVDGGISISIEESSFTNINVSTYGGLVYILCIMGHNFVFNLFYTYRWIILRK